MAVDGDDVEESAVVVDGAAGEVAVVVDHKAPSRKDLVRLGP